MLSSSQVQHVENSIKKGKTVIYKNRRILGVTWMCNQSPVLDVEETWFDTEKINPSDIIIGDILSKL